MAHSSRAAATTLVLALLAPACAIGPGLDAGEEGESGSGGAWFELGHLGQAHFPDGFAVDPLPYDELHGGEAVDMIAGGQGLVMFALPIRGGEFSIDLEAEEPDWPILDVHIDVEDHNDGIGGHFARIANYPVWFKEAEPGTYEFFFLTILLPEDDPLEQLVGLPARIEATLQPSGMAPISLGVDFVVGAAPGA